MVADTLETLVKERDDVIDAIRELRSAIASLNREGRERLLEAFDVVNGHFKRLFTHLFGGGTADLQLIESEDPLEAGLEIVARPPGIPICRAGSGPCSPSRPGPGPASATSPRSPLRWCRGPGRTGI